MMYIFLDSFFRTCFTIFSVFFCFWIVRHTFLPIYSICFCLFVCLFFAVRVPATALGFWRSRVDVKALFFIVIQLMKKIDNVKMRFLGKKIFWDLLPLLDTYLVVQKLVHWGYYRFLQQCTWKKSCYLSVCGYVAF